MSEARAISQEIAELAAHLTELCARLRALEGSSAESQAGQPASRLLSVPEVAERLSLPKARTYALAREGRIGGVVRIGRQIRFEPGALEAWIRNGGRTAVRSRREEE